MRMTLHVRLMGAVLLGSCEPDAGFAIEIVTPSSAALDPTLDERLAALVLVDENGDRVLAEEPFRAGSDRLTLPRLPLGFHGDLRIDLVDRGRRVLGLGRTPDVRISADKGTVVSDNMLRFYVRKPLAYVGSALGTSVTDITRSPSEAVPLPAVSLTRVTAMAATASGREVLVATTGAPELFRIDTRSHEATLVLGLPSPARRLVVDPTGRAALALHDSGVTFVALPDGRGAAPHSVSVESPGVVAAVFAADGETAFLARSAAGSDCRTSGTSSLVERRSRTGAEIAPPLSLSYDVTDIDVHPVSGNLVAASPCRGAVVEIDRHSGAKLGTVFPLAAVSEVSAVGRGIVGLGSRTAAGGVQELQARVWPGDSAVVIPWPKTRFSYRSDDPLTKVIVEILPWRAEIRDVAVGPELDRVVMAARFDYRATTWCDGATATSWGHLTVSLTSGTVVSYVETRRDASAMGCTITGGPVNEHEPTAVAILFGGT